MANFDLIDGLGQTVVRLPKLNQAPLGQYELEAEAFKYVKGHKGEFAILEARVVKSTDVTAVPVGSTVSHMIQLDVPKNQEKFRMRDLRDMVVALNEGDTKEVTGAFVANMCETAKTNPTFVKGQKVVASIVPQENNPEYKNIVFTPA